MTLITKYNLFLENKNDADFWKILPKEVKDLHKLFKQNGEKIYVVGGAVRDFLFDKKPKDFDVTTSTMPDKVVEIINESDDFNIPAGGIVGKRFGVVIVKHQKYGDSMEIATFRKDITKGRNPKVKVGVSMEDDAKRRDLKMNALYFDLDSKEIIDLVGGREAIENRQATFVGEPAKRIEEDPLRILRFFRFSAVYGYTPNEEETEAIKANRKLESIVDGELKRVSSEAIWTEFTKSWSQATDFTQYLKFFSEFDMWDEVFPGVKINEEYKRTTDFYVTMHDLFKNSKLTAKQMHDQFRIDKKTGNIIGFLDQLNQLNSNNAARLKSDMTDRYHMGSETIREWIRINEINDPIYYAFLRFEPVNAQDLLDQGMTQGAELGRALAQQNQDAFEKLL